MPRPSWWWCTPRSATLSDVTTRRWRRFANCFACHGRRRRPTSANRDRRSSRRCQSVQSVLRTTRNSSTGGAPSSTENGPGSARPAAASQPRTAAGFATSASCLGPGPGPGRRAVPPRADLRIVRCSRTAVGRPRRRHRERQCRIAAARVGRDAAMDADRRLPTTGKGRRLIGFVDGTAWPAGTS
jgi:hypothetical protein